MRKKDSVIQIAVDCIQKSLTAAAWWSYVQKEVKHQLNFLLDNINTLGIPFKDALLGAFRYEYSVRYIKGEALKLSKPGALFGKQMTEECYQSAINPVKMLLHLNDWTVPNDADVQACMQLIQQIEILEQLNVFKSDGEPTKTQIEQAVGKATPLMQPRKRLNSLSDLFNPEKKDPE